MRDNDIATTYAVQPARLRRQNDSGVEAGEVLTTEIWCAVAESVGGSSQESDDSSIRYGIAAKRCVSVGP